MTIQGSVERIFDSVLPHEITHMIYASHFRRPLPRWADEGGATSVEHPSEKQKHRAMLVEFLRTGRGIAFNQMFAMTDYPARRRCRSTPRPTPFPSTSFSRAGGGSIVEFMDEGMRDGQWADGRGPSLRHRGPGDAAKHVGELGGAGLPRTAARSQRRGRRGVPRQARPEPNLVTASATRCSLPRQPGGSLPGCRPGRCGPSQAAARGWPAAGRHRSARGARHAAGGDRRAGSRPQSMEPVRQTILEWEAPPTRP